MNFFVIDFMNIILDFLQSFVNLKKKKVYIIDSHQSFLMNNIIIP